MSLLTTLLKTKESYFDLAIKQLEDLTDKPGLDTALIGELLAKGYDRAGKMGLDPDFNGKELYQSLINRVREDNKRVAKILGATKPDNVEQICRLAMDKVSKMKLHEDGWFLKKTVAKRMLRKVPPQNMVKRLGYKNVAEMLAAEDIQEIYVALRFSESSEWMNDSFLPQYKQLTFKDFEHRKIKFVYLEPSKWGYELSRAYVVKKVHNITHSKEMGVITVVPMEQKSMPGITLKVLPLLIHYVYEVRLYSAFFKLIGIKDGFGEKLLDTLVADTSEIGILGAGRKVHWRVIQRYYGKLKDEAHPEAFEPHVNPEDLHWRKAEEVLQDIDPSLNFWNDMEYVALDVGGEVVTFNLFDVAFSYSNKLKYEERFLYHFREALWNELFMRYMGQETLEDQILRQLDNELIAPEKIIAEKSKVNS